MTKERSKREENFRTNVRTLALSCGFQLKKQENGTMDLNEYVYVFAQTLLATNPSNLTIELEIPEEQRFKDVDFKD